MASTTSTSAARTVVLRAVGMLGALALVLMTGCSSASEPSRPATTTAPVASAPTAATTPPDPVKVSKTISMSARMKRFANVAELAAEADLIVQGRVLSTEYVYSHESAWTKSQVEVLKSWSSGAKAGDVLTVVTLGGITSMANLKKDSGRPDETPVTEADKSENVRMLLEGEPLPAVGDESVYFLGKGDIGIVPGEYFVVVGAFQGRYVVRGGNAARFEPGGDDALPAGEMSVAALGSAIDAAPRKSRAK